jgi:hypothetical protein
MFENNTKNHNRIREEIKSRLTAWNVDIGPKSFVFFTLFLGTVG